MAPTCPHCGLALDDGASANQGHDTSATSPTNQLPIVTDIGTGLVAPPLASPAARKEPSRLRPILAVAGVALIGIIAASVLFRSNEDPVADQANAPAELTNNTGSNDDLSTDRNLNGADSSGDSGTEGAGGDPDFPPSDAHMAADSIADLFASVVDGDRRWSAVYPSPLGLQVLNASGANEPAIEVAVGFEEASRFPLISDGSTSWAIDPATLQTAYLVSTQYLVIDIDREGRVGFINDSLTPPNIGESSFGAWGPGFDLPAGADVLPVSGRALFVLPATGGTYEYQVNGVVRYSNDVLVAASSDSEVFQRCNDQLDCDLYAVTPAHPDGTPLDFDVRSDVWISPDGDVLVVQEPDTPAQIVWLDAGTRIELEGVVRAVDWSDDGSRAAILSDDELAILLPNATLASVTLPIEPVGSSVLLVASDLAD